MRCPDCDRQDVGEIRFSTIGSGVNFFYCRYCEHRWWVSAEGLIELDGVLDAATTFAQAR